MLALCTLWSTANATLIFHESFDKDAGQLSVGRSAACNDSTTWWTLSGWYADSEPNNPIKVVEGSLSYPGYVTTGTGNKVQLKTVSGTKDVRRFKEVETGSVYAAAIINMSSATSTCDYFFGLCDGGTSYYGKVYAQGVDGGFQLAIAKNSETKTTIPYTSTLKYNTDYLIVVEYVFKKGVKNDSVNLWVNPTKSTTKPTLVCDMAQANTKADPSKLAGVYLIQTTNAPTLYIDEIKVATAWDDLFESGDTPEPETKATITTSTATLSFGSLFVGDTRALTFTVSGKNLSSDITLANDNAELVLDQTTITKAAAEADGGVEVKATLTAATAGTPTAKITLYSDGADAVTISVYWNAIAVTKVSTIAALKAAAGETAEEVFLYTGEAVITYSEKYGYEETPTFYVEDETGAVCIYYYFENEYKVGDKIKDFKVVASQEDSRGILPFALASTMTVVSSGNTPTPQVVTLKELQDNAADYLLELVKVENVTLDNTEANYKAGNNAISQSGTSGAISLTADNTLVGTAKPTTADITGISYYTSGYNIRVRSAADIVVKAAPTAIETISLDQLTGEYEIYTVSGVRVAELQAGVNIVRKGNQTYKVIR